MLIYFIAVDSSYRVIAEWNYILEEGGRDVLRGGWWTLRIIKSKKGFSDYYRVMTGFHPDCSRQLRSATKPKRLQQKSLNTPVPEGSIPIDDNADPSSPILNSKSSITCGKCIKPIPGSDDRMECDCCKKMFHLSCTSFNKDIFLLMAKHSCFDDILWTCNVCKRDAKFFLASSNNLLKLLSDLQCRVTSLETNSNSFSKIPEDKKVFDPKSTQPATTSHQVLVIPDGNQTLTVESLCDIAKKNLPNVPIKKIGITKKGHGFINVPDKNNCDNAVTILKNNYNAVAKSGEVREFLPKITISDISTNDYSNDNKQELKAAILNKNPKIKACVEEDKSFDILFLTQGNLKTTCKAIVRVHPDILAVIKTMRYRLYLDFASCRVSDRFHVKQCYRCQKFGHRNDACPLKLKNSHICRFCAEGHESSKCELKNTNSKTQYKCANCSGNHSTTDASCSVLQRQLNYVISRTKGMENISKNLIPRHAIVT